MPLLPSLALNALQLSNAGSYRVVASNSVGSTISSNANSRVTPTVVAAWGSSDARYGATNIPSSLTNAVSISCGDFHGLAMQGDGRIVSWGPNEYGLTNVPITSPTWRRSRRAQLTMWHCAGMARLPPGATSL